MTILVTGAAGYIGSQIVHTLNRVYEQVKVIGVDDLSTGHTCPLPRDFECFHGDVGHQRFMGNLIDRYKVKRIVHCAAKVVVPESVEFPVHYYENNTAATLALAAVAVDRGVEGIVFSSTAAVYGQMLGGRLVKEDDQKKPVSPYGWSKLMAEQMLRDVHIATGLDVTILRYFNVAGADPLGRTGPNTEHGSHLIPRVVRAGLGRIPKLLVYGDGQDVRDYVHVADLAAAHLSAIYYERGGCREFNVGTGRGYSVMEVIEAVEDALGTPVPWEPAQRREGDPRSVVADSSSIQHVLGWRSKYELKDMVQHAIDWERSRSYRAGNGTAKA